MLDRDLAEMYGVQTKVLNQAVKRNIERFPEDFMFQLTSEETNNWRSQFVTSNSIKMGLRRNPYAFTELGVAMLSSILSSKLAIQVNITSCELPPKDVSSYRSKMSHLIEVRCIIFLRTPVYVFLHGFYLTLFCLINDICRQI